MPETPTQWNDKISLEMTYGEAILLLGEMSCGAGLMINTRGMGYPRQMLELGQRLIETILVEAEEETVAPFREAWSKLYYGSRLSNEAIQ